MKKNQKGPFAAGGKFAKTAPSGTKAKEAKKVEMVSAEPQAVDDATPNPAATSDADVTTSNEIVVVDDQKRDSLAL